MVHTVRIGDDVEASGWRAVFVLIVSLLAWRALVWIAVRV
jgi:hypothetical protein